MRLFSLSVFLLISLNTVAQQSGVAYLSTGSVVLAKGIKTNNPGLTKTQIFIDSIATNYLQNKANSSFCIGIIQDNHTESYFYGETKKGTGRLPNGKSLYEIASVTKTFTALVLAHAVNEGKIKLDDDIRKYIPGKYPDLEFNGIPIRVAALSNHTSGLPSFPSGEEKDPDFDPSNPFLKYSKSKLYQFLSTFKPDTVPGIKSVYSNPGFAVLGNIVEGIYGLSLEKLVQQFITGPLKMKHTWFEVPASDQTFLTTGYDGKTGRAIVPWQFADFKAAGGLKSNLDDMLIYLKANMMVINADYALTQQETNRQTDFRRGLAWMIEPLNNEQLIRHNGGTSGYRSYCGFIKNRNTGLLILSNSTSDIDDLATDIFSFLLK